MQINNIPDNSITLKEFMEKYAEEEQVSNLFIDTGEETKELKLEDGQVMTWKEQKKIMFSNTKIKILENVKIKGHVDLTNSKVIHLKGKIIIEGYFNARSSKLESIPDNAEFKKTLACTNSNLVSVGDNVTVGGMAYFSETKLKRIGKNLKIGKFLYIRNVPASLPEDAVFEKKFIDYKTT